MTLTLPIIPSLDPGSAARPTIAVRHAEPDDTASLHRIFAEPEIVYWTFELTHVPLGSAQRHTTGLGDGRFTLVGCADGQVAGSLGFTVLPGARQRHVGRLGPIAVSTAWQGRGVGAALMRAAVSLADDCLGLVRLELIVYADNEPAIALYRRFGFVREGTHRALGFRAGRHVDLITMARVRGARRRTRRRSA
jgi:L-phenylalanine/L-methionine N-acetyltransferase